jgi:hypothetical protein
MEATLHHSLPIFLSIFCVYIVRHEIISFKFQDPSILLLCCVYGILFGFGCPISLSFSSNESEVELMKIFMIIMLTMMLRRYIICATAAVDNKCPLYIWLGFGGCLISSVSYILDWEMSYQKWPVPSFYGLIGGILLAWTLDSVGTIYNVNK